MTSLEGGAIRREHRLAPWYGGLHNLPTANTSAPVDIPNLVRPQWQSSPPKVRLAESKGTPVPSQEEVVLSSRSMPPLAPAPSSAWGLPESSLPSLGGAP